MVLPGQPLSRAASAEHETIYRVLSEAARRASRFALIRVALTGTGAAAVVALLLPRLWPLAIGLLVPASVGVWGLAERASTTGRARRALLVALAILGTLLAVGALVGMFVVLFTGDGRSPYDVERWSPGS